MVETFKKENKQRLVFSNGSLDHVAKFNLDFKDEWKNSENLESIHTDLSDSSSSIFIVKPGGSIIIELK